MPNIELSFTGRSEHFSVRSFHVREGLSAPFRIALTVRTELDDADLDALTGAAASFAIATSGDQMIRWNGVCSHAELVHAEPTGLSTYAMTLVPEMALLAHRTNCRVFRRLSGPDIAATVLREWGLEVVTHLDAGAYPVLDFRVQYNESDLAFASRMLEEAGVTYFFRTEGDATRVVLSDRPGNAESRGEPIPFRAEGSIAHGSPYVSGVHRATHLRPGAYRLRDYDFQRPAFDLRGDASTTGGDHTRLSRYEHAPGAALALPGADGRGPAVGAVAEQSVLAAAAQRRLDAARVDRHLLIFATNVLDLAPGAVVSIAGHPRSDVTADTRLLVIGTNLEGGPTGDHHLAVRALFAAAPYRPPLVTPKTRIHGVQSATVVGPPGEEIHVDEAGRVRVLFPWDLEGLRGDGSSCWVRVSQAWAGSGFGVTAIPRVGDEVLVAFLDGDPDQPVVVGRLHNATHGHPWRLPEERAITGVRTQSTPGGGGYNELRFDDRAGAELVALRAQRDLDETVVADHRSDVGRDRTEQVGGARSVTVGGDESRVVGGHRSQSVSRDSWEHTGGNAAEIVGGDQTLAVRGHRSLTVHGASRAAVEGPASASVGRDLALSVAGSLSVSVGGAEGLPGSLHARGSWFVGSDEEVVIRADQGLSLQCGTSVVRITADKIEISAQTVVHRGADVVALKGGKALLQLADEASLAAPATRLFGKSSSLELTADASIKGTKVKLNHREGDPPSRSADEAKPETRPLRMHLSDGAFRPYAGKAFELTVQGVRYTGTTDGDGNLSQDIPTEATRAQLVLWVGDPPTGERHVWNVTIGEAPAPSTLEGARARLGTLGYAIGSGERLDPVTRSALREFQEDHDLDPTGELDGATSARLAEVHGH